MPVKVIQPEGWARPRGYSNGMVGEGQTLCIGGQIGWDAQQRFVGAEFLPQFEQAVANIIAIVEAAGGQVSDIARMTVYVTDIHDYRRSVPELGPIWKRTMGRHFPAMAVVAVSDLVEPEARVEIEATAFIQSGDAP